MMLCEVFELLIKSWMKRLLRRCFQELRSVLKFDVRRALKQYGMYLEEIKDENLLSTAAKAP